MVLIESSAPAARTWFKARFLRNLYVVYRRILRTPHDEIRGMGMTGTSKPTAGQTSSTRSGDQSAVPADLRLMSVWEMPERGTRGPKPRHDRAVIASAAVRIADAEGLDRLTMRRVATELGMATMTLYNYLPTKDHLAQLVIDRLAAEYAYPQAPPADKRSAIAELAGQAREIARRHPWVTTIMQPPYPPGPNGLRYIDYFLGLLDGSGLGTGARLEVIALISGFATMYGAMQATLARQGVTGAQHADMHTRAFARAAASGQYPNLAAALVTAGPARGQDDIFESAIRRLLDVARPADNPR
jgi:AcrR family transcriptional regulator